MAQPADTFHAPRITIFFFHPFVRRSQSNSILKRAVEKIPGVNLRDMYETYPTLNIDVDREQEVLTHTDVAVFQHPFYWYNCPSLMKEWLDAVLEKGWAYGEGGDKLQGKYWLQVITTGGAESAYNRKGGNEFTPPELLRPFERSARLCGMKPLTPFIVHGAPKLTREDRASAATRYRELIERMQKGEYPPVYSTVD